LAGEVEVFSASPPPERFVSADCGKVFVCSSKTQDIAHLSKREEVIKENFNWDICEMHR
jgi:hypothetical protein